MASQAVELGRGIPGGEPLLHALCEGRTSLSREVRQI